MPREAALQAEVEHLRTVLVHILCDLEDWERGERGQSWATLVRIGQRVRAELAREPDEARAGVFISNRRMPEAVDALATWCIEEAARQLADDRTDETALEMQRLAVAALAANAAASLPIGTDEKVRGT